MVKVLLKVAFAVFSFLGLVSFAISVVLFMLALVEFVSLMGEDPQKASYRVSYQEVENIMKAKPESAAQQQDTPTQMQPETKSQEDMLLEEILKSFRARGFNINESYIQQIKQHINQNFQEEQVRIEYLKGFKNIIELAPIQEMDRYIGTYDNMFITRYTQHLKEREEKKVRAYALGGSALSFFIISLLLSIVIALLSVERNTSEILSNLRTRGSLGISLLSFLFLFSCSEFALSPENAYEKCKDLMARGDYTKAVKICERACRNKMKDACMKQAYILDRYIQGGAGQALDIYTNLCNDGVGEACFLAGSIYYTGRLNVEKNTDKAIEMYKKGCDYGWQQACAENQRLTYEVNYPPIKEVSQKPVVRYNNEEQAIKDTVISYHNAVAEERIYDALDYYVSYRKPQIKIDKLTQIAEGTEYYVVEEVRALNYYNGGRRADVYVRVRQKPVHSPSEQVWEGVWIMEKEGGEWKIVRTPGRRIR